MPLRRMWRMPDRSRGRQRAVQLKKSGRASLLGCAWILGRFLQAGLPVPPIEQRHHPPRISNLFNSSILLSPSRLTKKRVPMTNRVKHAGLENHQPFLNAVASTHLRSEIDTFIDRQIENWYATVPYAAHLEGKTVDSEYYRRHLIETAWRIRLLRVSESKALAEIAKRSPKAAQIWANYEREEMLHDELFIQDLARAGVSREQFLATEPYLSTKLLTGFFSYLLDHEGPLGVVAYSY